MALDLIGGPVFTVLFEGVKLAMGRTETFKELLRDLKFTLECLRRQATAIQQIGRYNVELGLPNDEIEDLERQMHSGARLVFKLLNFRLWNYCCINCYTDQLVDLDRSLRRLLENLMLQEIRDVKEILDLSRKNRKELEEVKEAQLSMHKILEQIAGVVMGEASTSAAGGGNIEMVPDQNEGNNGNQAVASLDAGTRTALGAIFGMLLEVVIQVKDKNVMFKPLLEDLKSTLESLKPLIEEMAQHNKVLDRPKEELQRFALQMESGLELICKCSKVRLWASYKKYEYTNKLLGLDGFCRRQLSILREQVARDVKETSVSIRNVKEEILVLIRKTATVIKRRKRSTGVVQKSYDKSRPSIHERYDTMSDVQWQKSDEMKQHFRPIAGGAPFITCYNCFKLLRIPTGFPLSKRRCHELRCGVCLIVLKFSLPMECGVCSNVQFSHQKKCSVCSNVLKISLQKKSHVVPYKVLSAAEPPTYEVDNLSSNPASTSEPFDGDPEAWLDNYFDRFSYCTSPEVDPGIFTPSDSLKYQYAKKCETDLEFLSNISELKWDSQCKVVEDVKNYLKGNAQASYSMSSKNFVEPLIKFLRDAHDLDDVKAQRDGFKLLTTFVSKNRNAISYVCEDAYRLLASSLDSKVTEEVLAIMEILSGHQDCRCKISASGALPSILKLLDSQIRNIQGQAIKVLYNLSSDKEVCSQMVSMECIPKLVPFFEDGVLTGNCISILKNLCDTEGARISIAGTNGCIASVVNILDTGTKEEQEHAVDVLLSLCSQSIDYCHLVMHEGVIPALENLSANGTERARINSMEVLRLLSDIDYVHEQESAEPAEPEQEYLFMGTDVAEVVETLRKPHSFKVYHSMCIELLKLVDRISRIFPDIEAARPRCSTGIQALCMLNSAIEKAKQLLQYCSESSKLYLACTGTVMVSRCQKSRNLLVESLCQIQSWVPVILVAEISKIIDDLKGATFKLDPSEEEAGKIVRGLLHQDVSALNSVEDSELKAFQLASLRLHITSKKEVLIEKRSIKKLLKKVGDGDPRKKQILTHFFYLLKKYENLILVKQTESASMRQQGSLSSENSGNGFKCNQYAEVEPHAGYGEYEAQSSMLPPEEFSCGISSRLMYDPVVIASGQTYERMWIQKWFDEGHDTCPKTNVKLAHLSLTPNIAMNELISRWCTKYGVTIPNPSMQQESLRAWENSSTSIGSLGSSMNDLRLQMDLSTMSFGSLDTSFNSDASRTKTGDGLSLVQIDDDSLKHQYSKKCETDLEFLSNISELKWDAQCTVVEDVKNYLKCNAQASYSMSSKNFVEPLIKFLRDAHDRDDVKAQRDGFKLLSTFVSENRNGIPYLCEDAYSLLASSLDSKVTKEVLAIMEIVSGHQHCRSTISASGALPSILKLLDSQNRNIQGQAIKVLYNLSFDKEVCSEMVSLDCIPKLVPFFEDSALTGYCIFILKNLCDTEGARISIAETNGCIASVVNVLNTGTKRKQENAVDILLSLCSQGIEYCRLVMHEGFIPALVQLSVNGTERARINSMQILRLLRDIEYVHDQEYASSSATSLFSEATTSTFQSKDDRSTDGHILETSNLRVFRFAELKTATRNFSPEEIIGEDSFGNIFSGWVDEKTLEPSKAGMGMIVAIKKLDPEGLLGVREWQLEVYFLGRLSHPNLVKLLGYCCEGNELLLVYEYIQNGSLKNHLFIRNPNIDPLSWDSRIKIAIGAARGLAFLHSSVNQAIYRDFKASNILVDRNYNAKISTFGLANLGPTGGDSHVSSRVMGSHGYAAPEYIATGHLYLESDVYGFGVVLLEILTGLRVVDTKRPQGQHNLVDWAKPLLSDKRKLETVMDVRMEGQYSFEAALKTAHVTRKCLASDPKSRPSMKEVVETLEHIQEFKDN